MGDWENYVTKVCVLGRPDQMRSLAADWEALFYNADTVASELHSVITQLEKTFTGPGGDAYRKHLQSIHDSVQKIRDDHSGIVHSLRQAAEDLDEAQQQMPVPDYMMDNVNNRRAELDALNMAGARAMTFGSMPEVAILAPDAFYKPLADSFVGNWGREFFGHFSAWWDDWDGKMTADAKKWYDKVNQENLQTALATPDPSPTRPGYGYTDTNPDLGGGPAGGSAGHVPGVGSPNMRAATGGITPGTHGYGGPGSLSDTSGLPGDHVPSTGLAGAGPGGLSGLGSGGGLGTGGLGSGGLGGGAGGLSGLGSPGTGAMVGKPVSPTGMPMAGMGGMPMGAGRGGAGRGGAAGRGRPGAAGMAGGHGGRGTGEEDERYTWLQEDDDVWGGGSDAPSGIIGQ
jgi:uncharacterized protein YukE